MFVNCTFVVDICKSEYYTKQTKTLNKHRAKWWWNGSNKMFPKVIQLWACDRHSWCAHVTYKMYTYIYVSIDVTWNSPQLSEMTRGEEASWRLTVVLLDGSRNPKWQIEKVFVEFWLFFAKYWTLKYILKWWFMTMKNGILWKFFRKRYSHNHTTDKNEYTL